MSAIRNVLVYESRIANVKSAGRAMKDSSAFDTVETLAKGFGRNNRTLIRNVTGGIKGGMGGIRGRF